MLISFRVKNFRSIVDATIDLRYAEGKAPNGYGEMETIPFFDNKDKSKRVVPVLALYGANASGKTNLVRALNAFRVLIESGNYEGFGSNKLHPDLKTTCFEMFFLKNDVKYSYFIEYSEEGGIKKEVLKKGDIVIFHIENATLNVSAFLETIFYSKEKLVDILKVECSNGNGKQTMSFLAKIAQNYPGLNADLSNAYRFIKEDLTIAPTNEFHAGEVLDALERIFSGEDVLRRIETLIKKMDLGIKRIEFNKEEVQIDEQGRVRFDRKKGIPMFPPRKTINDKTVLDYFRSYHTDAHGNEVGFNFVEESAGTQISLGLIAFLLYILEMGKIVFIDELDRSLHSLVFREVVRLFKDKRYNTKNAQIVFTAHNTDLLDTDILRVSELGIVNKTLTAGTTLTRLSDFEGIRNVTGFRRRYLNGEFSGIPFPCI